jgi:hypothetical protein
MSKIMQTTGADLPAKEIQGQRVVSYKQIAELHQVDEKSIRRNHERNKIHFIEGVDDFTLSLAWEVQRMLVNITRSNIQTIESKLEKLGYQVPSQQGMRSWINTKSTKQTDQLELFL